MELSAKHIFLIALLMFLVGYCLQKKRVKGLQKKLLDAEDTIIRSDKDFLAVLKENEALRQEILNKQNEELRIISIQEILKKKKN